MEKWREILNNGKVKDFEVFHFDVSLKKIYARRGEILDDTFQSGIIFFVPYFSKAITKGNISAYAAVKDYHNVILYILEEIVTNLVEAYPAEKFASFVDISPLSEVELAAKAGLGVLGQNSMIIHSEYGSYGFLGTIVTTLSLPVSEKIPQICLNCGACREACPTKAITGDFRVKGEVCLSHITQKKGELTEQEKEFVKKGGFVWGCDICQEVCPMNKSKKETYIEEFLEDIITTLDEKIILNTYKTRAYGFRGKNVLLRNLKLVEEGE